MRILLALLLIGASSITQGQHAFTINGAIEKGTAYKIHLRYTTDTETAFGVDVSQTADVVNGKFSFNGTIKQAVQGYLVLDGHSSRAALYLDTGNISVTLAVETNQEFFKTVHKVSLITIKGSFSDSVQRSFMARRKEIITADVDDSVCANKLAVEILSLAKAYPDHNFVSEVLSKSYQLNYKQASDIYNALSPDQRAKSERNGVSIELERAKQIDKMYPFIEQIDTAGSKVNGKNANTKYILLTFQAAECSPCKNMNKELIPLYQKHHERGFEIITISIDDSKQKWIDNVTAENLPWYCVSDLKGRQNEIARYFKIPYIPFPILVDANGKVLLIDPLTERLTRTIEKLFVH